EFESGEFNREFNVKSPDREFAYKLIDARMMRWLQGTEGAFGFEIAGPWVLVYSRRLQPMSLVPLFGTAKGFVDAIPRLVRTAAQATTGQSPAAQAAAEGPFVAALGRLFAVAENYPELKANQNFLELQRELENTEDRIQASRRFYNANVQDYNRRVQSFPSVL